MRGLNSLGKLSVYSAVKWSDWASEKWSCWCWTPHMLDGHTVLFMANHRTSYHGVTIWVHRNTASCLDILLATLIHAEQPDMAW